VTRFTRHSPGFERGGEHHGVAAGWDEVQLTCENALPSSAQLRSDMRAEVEEVIKVIRPAIQADNGDIYLRDVDETSGVVSVELIGACVSCPASTVTLKAGIERILKDRVEGVTEVINVGESAATIGETSVSL
jgi:Fe-S cluster biogenesis protein NfuA